MVAADRSGSGSAPETAGADALDLHEGIDDPQPLEGGCARWPEHLRLLNELTGELVRGRCRATNLCPYCARLAAVETSEMLALDALESAPTLLVVLTARELLTRAECRRHLTQLRRALVKRWPAIEWAVLVEFQRRGALHLNLLVKGVDVDEAGELHKRMCARWCDRVDALPVAQSVTPVYEVGGAVRYVTQHFMKPEQAPPIGWRGHRYSATRGYLVRPASVMREEARRSLRGKRELRRQLEAGLVGHDAELAVQQALQLADAATWRLHQLHPTTSDGGEAPHRRARRLLAAVGAVERPLAPAAAPPDQIIRTRPGEPVKRPQAARQTPDRSSLDRLPAGATLTPRRGRGSPDRGSVRPLGDPARAGVARA